MPPKKQQQEQRIPLGRPGNNLKSGIVGLANVGKSTFFQAITRCPLGNPANYPFATIEPEEARVIVPSPRFDVLVDKYKPKSEVPAFLTIYDIAGLTKGAAEGEGLGNAFLSNIRAVDAIYQVVRCFDDADIIHIEGDVDPVRDLRIINDELRFKDIEFVKKARESTQKLANRGGQSFEVKQAKDELVTMDCILEMLENGKKVYHGVWSSKQVELINSLYLLTAKPTIYLVNLSERDYIRRKNKHLLAIKEWVDQSSPGDLIIPISVCLESRLSLMETDEEREAELKKLETTSALPKIIQTMRSALGLISFFTCGPDEVREWTIREGTKAPAAAGVIHGDLQKTFILAQVTHYPDLIELGDENAVKANGKLHQKGKEYVIEDGDIVYFRAAAGKN